MKNSKYSQFLDLLIGDQIPQNINLAPKIHTKIQGKKGAVMNKRMKVLVPSAVVLTLMVVVTLTVPAVAETFQRWIGYLPGFGQVQDEKLRTLAEPQSQTVDGVTLSVDEVVASEDKTLVKYSLSGVEEFDEDGEPGLPRNPIHPLQCFPHHQSFRWKQAAGYQPGSFARRWILSI